MASTSNFDTRINNNDDYNNNNNRNNASNSKEKYDRNPIDAKVFPLTFWMLKLSGFWAPITFKHSFLYFCYHFFAFLSIMSVVILIVTLILKVILPDETGLTSFSKLVDCFYLMIVWINSLLKIANVIVRRSRIINLLENDIMGERWADPRDEEEQLIRKESEFSEKKIFFIYLAVAGFNSFMMVSKPIMYENPNNAFMLNCYMPCNRTDPTCFWTTYTIHFCGVVSITGIYIGFDCLVFNFIDRLSSYLKVLQHRFLKLPYVNNEKTVDDATAAHNERLYLKQCIQDHYSISEAIDEVNDVFYECVCLQFLSSCIAFCTNVFLLSKQNLLGKEFFSALIYLNVVFTQNFSFCYYGYKITKNSSDLVSAVFNMDWMVLGEDIKKMLLFIMLITSKEVAVFNNALVNLSPETFLKILKISYSVFNLLQQT